MDAPPKITGKENNTNSRHTRLHFMSIDIKLHNGYNVIYYKRNK